MARGNAGLLLHYLRRLIVGPAAETEDGACLRRFVAGDESAFAVLVRRHGPMVLGICRRILRDVHEAEDAFQAAFLVLARKAPSVQKPERLANWLYGVACRTALRARSTLLSRATRQQRLVIDPPAPAMEESANAEVRPLLDEEIARLPEKYRVPIVLCYLQGLTNEQAAEHLGCPRGTILSRLSRARDLLRTRLTRRGVAVPAAGAMVVPQTAQAVPAALVEATVAGTVRFVAATAASLGTAGFLAEGVLKGMTVAKRKCMVLVLLVLSVLGACVGVYLLTQRWGKVPPAREPEAEGVTMGVTVVVVASYPGASAEEVERQVTIPLEVTMAGMPGLRSARSKSLFGLSHLRLEFEDGVEYAQAREEVINRLATIDQPLPAGVTPILSPAAAGCDILRYTLRGPKDAQGKDVYTAADLRALQDWVVEREFRRVPSVLDVTGSGGAVTRCEVHLDPDRLRRYGLTLQQVQNAIAESNANDGGDFVKQGVALNVRNVGLFGGGENPVQQVLGMKDPAQAAARLRAEEQRRLREIRSLVLATVNAVPVRLEDVVEGGRLAPGEEIGRKGVVLGHQQGQNRVGLALPGAPDENDRVLGVVFLRPGENRQETLDRVKARVQEINDTPGRLLPGVRLEPLWERADGAADDLLLLQAGLPANVSPQVASNQMRQARAILLHYPEVRAVLTQFGRDETGVDPAGAESGQIYVMLHPGKDRRRGRREILDEVQAKLSRSLPGIDWEDLPDRVDNFEAAFVATPGAGLLKIIGPDLEELERLAGKARGELQKLKGVSGVHVRHVLGKTHLEFRVDPDKCARRGVSVADVKNVIAVTLDGRADSHMIEGEKLFDIAIRWPKALRSSETSILDVPVDIINSRVPSATGSNQPPPAKEGTLSNTANPISAQAPRLRLRDLVSPVGDDGRLDPQGQFNRFGAASIWRENGRRLIAVRFSIRGRGEADVLAEAREKLAHLFQAPYQAVWSGGAP
jgi:RNA polymerase sigma factor (sigma-70 family)